MYDRATSGFIGRSAALLLALLPAGVCASAQTWLPVRSHNPFLQAFGVPAAEGAETRLPGETAFRLSFDISNHADLDELDGELAELDGESYFLNFAVRRGLASGAEIGLDLPFVANCLEVKAGDDWLLPAEPAYLDTVGEDLADEWRAVWAVLRAERPEY